MQPILYNSSHRIPRLIHFAPCPRQALLTGSLKSGNARLVSTETACAQESRERSHFDDIQTTDKQRRTSATSIPGVHPSPRILFFPNRKQPQRSSKQNRPWKNRHRVELCLPSRLFSRLLVWLPEGEQLLVCARWNLFVSSYSHALTNSGVLWQRTAWQVVRDHQEMPSIENRTHCLAISRGRFISHSVRAVLTAHSLALTVQTRFSRHVSIANSHRCRKLSAFSSRRAKRSATLRLREVQSEEHRVDSDPTLIGNKQATTVRRSKARDIRVNEIYVDLLNARPFNATDGNLSDVFSCELRLLHK